MTDRHTNWKCEDCEFVIRAKVSPQRCPRCDYTVLKPTDDAPTEDHNGSVETDDFDVDDALDRL